MQLFKVNTAGEVIFDKNEYKMYKPIYVILNRLMKVEGDHDGRKKMRNMQELKYVFFMSDWTKGNVYRHLPDNEKHIEAVMEAELPIDYEPDIEVKKCIEFYKKVQRKLAPKAKVLDALNIGLMQSAIYYEALNAQNNTYSALLKDLNEQLENEEDEGEKLDLIGKINTISDALAKNTKEMIGSVKGVEEALTRIQGLEKLVREEEAELESKSGNKELGRRENPDYLKRTKYLN